MTLRRGSGEGERFAFNPPSPRAAAPGTSAVSPAAPAVTPVASAVTPVASAFRRKTRAGNTPAEPRDWAFTWLLVFTAVLFFRPQDIFPPLAVFRLAEMSAIAGLVALVFGRLSRGQTLTRMKPEFAGVIPLGP